MKTADNLIDKLIEIENRIRENENPDGSCNFPADKVFIFLEAALSQIGERK